MGKTKEKELELSSLEKKFDQFMGEHSRAIRKWERYIERKAEREGISLEPDE